MSRQSIHHFSADEIADLREKANKMSRAPETCFEGWTLRIDQPDKILRVFKPLRLDLNYDLRGYQFMDSSGNGNGLVWAVPFETKFVSPEECETLDDRFLKPPRPPEALDDFRTVFESDGSARSYLMASLAARELWEYGAMWHGISWGSVRILGRDPWKEAQGDSPFVAPSTDGDWSWTEPRPLEWRPTVELKNDVATVTLICFSGLGSQRIYKITDKFNKGNYVFETERQDLALGPGGYVH